MFWLRISAWLWSNRFSGNCHGRQFWPNLIIVAVNEGQVELLSQKSRHKDIVDEKILGGLLKEEVKWKEDLKVVSPWRRWQSWWRWEHQRHRRCCCSSPGRTSPQDQLHRLLLTWADNTLSNKKSDCFLASQDALEVMLVSEWVSQSVSDTVEPTWLMWPWWVKIPTEDFTERLW